ncbi:MAG: ABC transporter permease [Treponema sp.]|jgi:peptide/nickel transport system permease protein|nr:ABC transporter permease [Treponema sp.]
MIRYIVKRLVSFIPILAAVSVLVFFLVRIVPSDPVASLTKGKSVSKETRAALMEEFHLDKPLARQYAIWISGVVRGDLSSSYQHRKPVLELLVERLPTTLQLTLMSSLLAAFFSITIGVVCAVTKNSFLDRILSGFLVFCASAPSFLLALVFMYLFAFKLRLFPSFGAGENFWDSIYYLILPSMALSLSMITLVGRITRSSLINEIESNYVAAEKAKGTPFHRIIFHHCLKNALIPVITIGGMQIGGMIVGAMLVENVFALGGIGILLIEGINTADYPVVQSIVLILVVVFMTVNLITDIIYAAIDPRIHAAWQGGAGK